MDVHMKFFFVFFVLILVFFTANIRSIAQISRGANNGEIYITVPLFYVDSTNAQHWGLFYSNDNGNHLSLQYNSTHDHFFAIGDSVSGKVFGCLNDSMWMSNDFGVTWSEYPTNLSFPSSLTAGGNTPGELYLEDNQFNIFSSMDYGQTFIQVNDSMTYFQLWDVGVHSGTVYAVDYFPQSYDPCIRISHNYGHTFSIQQLDSGFYDISRGAIDNELYLIRRNDDTVSHYHIFQSFNEGASLIPRGTITIPYPEWQAIFTGGRIAGTFYASRYTFDGYSGYICIDYSSDSAKTFSTNCYYLADLLTSTNSITVNPSSTLSQNAPNPFINQTSIKIDIKQDDEVNLTIYDVNGQMVKHFINSKMVHGEYCISWDGKNDAGIFVSPGVYFCFLKVGNNLKETKKMVYIR